MKTLLIVLTLAACHKNPEKRIDWVANHLENKLELRADQKPAFQGLVTEVKTHIAARHASGQATLKTVKAEFSKDALDVDALTTLAKAKVRERPSPEQLDGFIDRVATFYKTLDPKQQKVFAELVRDKLDWVD